MIIEDPRDPTAKELGYHVGDLFVVNSDQCTATMGAIVELTRDDGTDLPYFTILKGRRRDGINSMDFCEYFSSMRPVTAEEKFILLLGGEL